ncbi:Protein S100-P [Anas platyrhynchos]|uniref:Protein S100-P n=1 Tax=Anas platyrhynchos TaxID=8839 RepID=R0K1L8_ANAPL|nr:Protein S100-P [Anas platyrhynchos]
MLALELFVDKTAAQSSEKKVLAVWAIIPFLVAVGSLYCCYKKKRNSKLSGSAPLPVPEGGRQEEQTLEAAELCGRNESTSEEAEWTGKNKDANDEVFRNLDENGDSQVDFKEFVIFVAALTCCCHKYFEQKAAK